MGQGEEDGEGGGCWVLEEMLAGDWKICCVIPMVSEHLNIFSLASCLFKYSSGH